MTPFPYFEILKKAYELTLHNRWLWVFGLFLGGTGGVNFGISNYFSTQPSREWTTLENQFEKGVGWISGNPEIFSLLVAGILFLAMLLIILAGLSRGAVIWATRTLAVAQEANFKKSLGVAKRYFWQIIGLQVIVTAAFSLLFIIFALPIGYLFSVNVIGRAIVLSLLGLVIFIPALVVFGFLHLYGPIFVVLYNARFFVAIQLSFNLIRHKLKESIILAAVLVGLSFGFVLAVIFSLIIFAFPLGLLGLFLAKLGFELAIYTLLIGAGILSICYTIVLGAGFAVFQNMVWVLAVLEMVKTKKFEEKTKEEKAFVAEPAA